MPLQTARRLHCTDSICDTGTSELFPRVYLILCILLHELGARWCPLFGVGWQEGEAWRGLCSATDEKMSPLHLSQSTQKAVTVGRDALVWCGFPGEGAWVGSSSGKG